VRNLVCGEDNVVVLEEALGEEVAERVVFFVKGEDGGIGDAWCGWVSEVEGWLMRVEGGLRVSSLYSILDWPSSRRKSSNLHSAS
jgi:hypothetical protein